MSAVPPDSAEQYLIGATVVDAQPALTSPPPRSARALRNPRSLALAVLAAIALVFILKWAQAFFIPLTLGVLLAYMLNPLVSWLEERHLPRAIGATVVVGAMVAGLGAGVYFLGGEVASIAGKLPEVSSRISDNWQRAAGSDTPNPIQKMQQAAHELEKATTPPPPPRTSRAAAVVTGAAPWFDWRHLLWQGSMGLMGFFTQLATVVFLVYFLLLSAKTFKRKLLMFAGPTLESRQITRNILGEMNVSIQRFMLMLMVSNLLLAFASWLVFRAFGLENAGAWAAAAGLLHIVPYLGPALTALAVGIAALMQYDSFSAALAVAGASAAVATLVGAVVTTWMTGKIARMNTAAVFISLLFWAWLWGVWGMLLSIPLIVIVNVIAQHVKDLRPLALVLEA
ncbi:MAG TPA: AI-2E family transporter [Burkholderiales bacterium]|jgi:predicted PurR-regulated permease PerM